MVGHVLAISQKLYIHVTTRSKDKRSLAGHYDIPPFLFTGCHIVQITTFASEVNAIAITK